MSGCAFDLPILMYHEVESERGRGHRSPFVRSFRAFERQLDFLRQCNYKTITFSDLFRLMDGTSRRTGQEVLITFDDGYESFRTLVTPALRARGMTATVFLVAREIGGYNRWDVEAGHPRRPLMNEQAIREIIASGMEIGIHGWAHRDMRRCSPEELREEIGRSREHIEGLFGLESRIFAYPYGRYAETHFAFLKEAGYRGAVSFLSNERCVTSNAYAMRRLHVPEGIFRFRVKLSGAYLRFLSRVSPCLLSVLRRFPEGILGPTGRVTDKAREGHG
jgi:peptidoglycan/xylan/chitin deacetylase (PgdA/CDA1 family)